MPSLLLRLALVDPRSNLLTLKLKSSAASELHFFAKVHEREFFASRSPACHWPTHGGQTQNPTQLPIFAALNFARVWRKKLQDFCRKMLHSHSQRPRSSSSTARIETSGPCKHLKSAINGFVVQIWQIWLAENCTEQVLRACSKSGVARGRRFLVLTKRIVASGKENGRC